MAKPEGLLLCTQQTKGHLQFVVYIAKAGRTEREGKGETVAKLAKRMLNLCALIKLALIEN